MAERISLAEAYNNKDVITQIAILKDKLDSIPDADLTNVVLKTGDQIIDGEKTFNDPIVANGGVVFANSGIHVNGTLEVDGDIIQNGAAYETHAEQVFSVNDYIVTRDGQITGLPSGDLSGFHVKKYNGVDDSRLGVDNTGTMRVGDVGSEQPLATRDEVADMTSGALVKWDGVNEKLIAPSSNVGSDIRPVKIVNGEPVAVTGDLGIKNTVQSVAITSTSFSGGATTIKTIPITETGTYMVVTRIETSGSVAAGGYILGIASPNANTGWTQTCYLGSSDTLRLNATRVETLTAGNNLYIDFYSSGTGTLTGSVKIVRLV